MKEDFDQLMDLLRQLNPQDTPKVEVEKRAFEEILGSEYFHLIVAERDTKLVGSCYLNIMPNLSRSGRPYSVIENVITDSNYRNQGIGEAVIKHAVELAWRANCYKVMLMSGRKEEAVHRFYTKCGFRADEKQAYVQRAP